jgi:xanthine dehydrogenase accessory factor
MSWISRIVDTVAREGAAARVVIIATHGPTPRAVGAAMLVGSGGRYEGKVGRPELEATVLVEARELIEKLSDATRGRPLWLRRLLRIETGKVLGESTGGSVDLLLEAFGPAELPILEQALDLGRHRGAVLVRPTDAGEAPLVTAPGAPAPEHMTTTLTRLELDPRLPLALAASTGGRTLVLERLVPEPPQLVVYGTGLVARALVKLAADLPLGITWVDTLPGHFPPAIPPGVVARAVADPAELALTASAGSLHAVMTSDHDLDLGICRAVLAMGTFAYLGVIGSRLKRERLSARLSDDGFADAEIARVACPIGLPQIRSKVPAVIAVGIAAEMLGALQDSAGAGSNA